MKIFIFNSENFNQKRITSLFEFSSKFSLTYKRPTAYGIRSETPSEHVLLLGGIAFVPEAI